VNEPKMQSNRRAMPDQTKLETLMYPLVITRYRGSEVLLSSVPHSLPSIDVPCGGRPAEQFVTGVQQKYRLETYCLWMGPRTLSDGESVLGNYAVMEVLDQNAPAPIGMLWVFAREASSRVGGVDGAAIRRFVEDLDRYGAEPERAPFAKPAWIQELLSWAGTQLQPFGLRTTGGFWQLNASPTFSLIRLQTNRTAVWFKATGDPNTHELALSLTLADLFPRHVPRIISVHSAWNGWLSLNVAGTALDQTTDRSAWERAAEDLAELQISSIGKSAQLLRAGARDLRMERLAERVDRFLSRMGELMALQESRSPAPLSERELVRLADVLKQSCAHLEAFGLPQTLGHIDFNPGNILVTGNHCVFLDWAEGAVANPLLTFEYLVEHAVRRGITEAAFIEPLLDCYLRPWASQYSLDGLRQTRELSPLVAVFAYASANDSCLSQDLLDNPQRAGYFRALTRRMYREAIRVEQGSQPCLTT
jgi:hypothetical protein